MGVTQHGILCIYGNINKSCPWVDNQVGYINSYSMVAMDSWQCKQPLSLDLVIYYHKSLALSYNYNIWSGVAGAGKREAFTGNPMAPLFQIKHWLSVARGLSC